ncbi:hypothetical protein ACFLS9_03980 [Bacteroidota bacterium]
MGDLGTDMPLVLFVSSSKDLVSWAKESEEQSEKLGEDEQKLLKKTMSLCIKFEHKSGFMRRDLAHSSK